MKHSHKEEDAQHERHQAKHQPETPKNHPGANEKIELVKQSFHEMEKHAMIANERLRDLLNGLSKVDMIDRIKQLQLSDKHLNFLCEGIILGKDDQDIIVAIGEIRKGRPVNLVDDPIDHLNYTAY